MAESVALTGLESIGLSAAAVVTAAAVVCLGFVLFRSLDGLPDWAAERRRVR